MADRILKDRRKRFINSVGTDNVSWRHPKQGSLFIMRLIKTMQEYAWSCDVEEIFRKVRFSFELPEGRTQMPTTERVTLTRRFYLFPGH
uniref:Caspase 1 n=1 Tax=Oryctolagus cuniculus TaxID=9986 RepID=A0A5F9DTG7_RABIT